MELDCVQDLTLSDNQSRIASESVMITAKHQPMTADPTPRNIDEKVTGSNSPSSVCSNDFLKIKTDSATKPGPSGLKPRF
jgi:hypothetical protein